MLSIIIPTYNEKESILKTIEKIIKTIPKNQKYEIIVSDDNSSDKTWEIVEKYSIKTKNKNIKTLRRMSNRGLTPAVIDGYKLAKGDYFLVIDADGQHDEKIIPNMLTEIKKNDIVIGSRYIKGGGIKDWSKTRLFVSKFASLLAKPILKHKIKDPMSGYFMIKKEVFEKIKDKLNSKGYKVLLEIVFNSKNIKIKETPYTFQKREEGESKLSSKVIFEYLQLLIKYGIKKYNLFLKFCVVGLIGTIVNEGLLYFLTSRANLAYFYSGAIAIETSIITNFIMNNYWTWKSRETHQGFFKKLSKYNLVSLLALTINLGVLISFTEIFKINYLISNLIGIVLAIGINFSINNKWTFKKK